MERSSTSKPIIPQASTLGNSGRGYQGAYIGKGGCQEADSPFAIPGLLAEEADALPRVARDSVPAGAPSGLGDLRFSLESAGNTQAWDNFWREVFEGLEEDKGASSGNLG